MQPRKLNTILILVYLLPVFFYLLPAEQPNLIPEIRNRLGEIYSTIVIVFIVLYGIVLMGYWNASVIKRSQKWVITIITVFVLLTHWTLFIVLEIGNLKFSTPEVVFTQNFNNNRIYIREWRGIFKKHVSSEIDYRKPYLPFFHVYFTTPNNIELISADPEKLVFREFEYVADSVQSKNFFAKIKLHIEVDSIIQITKKDL